MKAMRQMGAMRFMQITGYRNEHLLQQMIDDVSIRFERDMYLLEEEIELLKED